MHICGGSAPVAAPRRGLLIISKMLLLTLLVQNMNKLNFKLQPELRIFQLQ